MIIKETINQPIEITKDIICDKCKSSTIVLNDVHMAVYATLNFNPGYGSKFDSSDWELQICEKCFWEIYEQITGVNPSTSKSNNLKEFPGCLIDRLI